MTQILVNGLIQGSLFGLIGLAFALVYATTRVFYLALGAIFTLAPYPLLFAMGHEVPWAIGALLSLAGSAAVGVACETLIHWPLERSRASVEAHFVGSLGAFLIIGQLIALLWGHELQVLRSGIDAVYDFAGVRLTRGQLFVLGFCSAALVATAAWVQRSETGLRLRALANNPPLLSVLGADVRRLRIEIFALSGILTATGALTKAFDVGFDPEGGMRMVLIAVAATIMGGRTSLGGAVLAGVMLGILRSTVIWYTSAKWEDVVTFGILAAVLLLFPRGIAEINKATRVEGDR